MRELLAYSQGAVIEEKLTLRIKADNSGNIYLPISGYTSEGLRYCPYDWKVKIDGGSEVRYTGIGSSGATIRVGYGLNALSIHTVEIRPQVEDYGWLRAFGYGGTSIAGSLINIISDKSYKGYANTEFYTGNWYKAYQYYGCNNLINTDEELLPDTLEIIGDNYRYYEYAGCTSLVHNADEKILKTVKVIGDNYRAYQYQSCTGINKINMRAINWASVGNNYRLNQYSGIGTDRNLVSIYIEGGIEEGGNWGLNNNNIKGIYVYKDLVGDYRTKLSGITSSKIQKNPDWDNFEYEFIEYIGLADSTGKIRIPVGGFSTSFTQDCVYDWMVSIDGGEEEEITGTGGQTYVSVGSGLTEGSEHRVVIKPKTISWGWGRAFGFHTTGAQAYIKEIIHDSYKCYATGRTTTGNHYKHGVFMGCTNLINSYEKLPTSVTSIGTDYMSECYGGCTSLKNAFWEILHKGITIGNNYRYHEYTGCSAMEVYEGLAGYEGTYPTNYKYEYLYGAGNNLKVYITRKENLPSTNIVSINSLGYVDNYTLTTITRDGDYDFSCIVYEGSSQGGTSGYVYKNGVLIGSGYAGDYGVRTPLNIRFSAVVGDVITMSIQRGSYGAGNCQDIKIDGIYNSIMQNSGIESINCFADDIYYYQHSNNWGDIDVSKYKGWYYQYKCYELKDINRYTKLLSQINMPRIDGWLEGKSGWDGGQYNRGVAINRKLYWDNLAVGITEYGKDSTGNNKVGVIIFNLSVYSSAGDRIINGVTPTSMQYWGGSNWSGSNQSFANALNYDINGNIYGNYAYNGSGPDGYGLKPIGSMNGTIGQTNSSAISRNGKYLWGNFQGWNLFHTETAYNFGSYKQTGESETILGNLIFSDDGYTMIAGNSDWSELTEYKLASPRTLSTKVATGNKLTIKGQVSMSMDGKYLFRFDDTTNTLYQYTYE